jgi:hypothetical protein
LLTLDDDKLLYFTGDSLPFGTDGRAAPQDDSSHVSKLLLVDSVAKDYQVVGKGVRNPQHAEFVAGTNKGLIAFMDIGGVTAEEINVVSLVDLLDTTVIENFGWGRNADGNTREGTMYIEPGVGGTFGSPPYLGNAPSPELGFVQPYAQFRLYGAVGASDFVAISGPVTSTSSFSSLQMLFADLNAGTLFGTVATVQDSVVNVTVCFVNITDVSNPSSEPFPSVNYFNGDARADPRFFQFPDGTAGVLLERTGEFFRFTEVEE